MTAPGSPDERPRTQPDGPRSIEAPWRIEYLERVGERERTRGETPPGSKAGFLVNYWNAPGDDDCNHVLVRTELGMILLNAYPYANGHLLCALGEPRPRLMEYTAQQRAALWELVELASDLCERTLQPQGLNIGVNQGRAAGAGVPNHLHVHVVPRWSGDTNFAQVIGQVRVNPSSLDRMGERYRAVLGSLGGSLGGPA